MSHSRPEPTGPTMTPAQALAELRAGNERFVDGTPGHPNQDTDRRADLVDGQAPFATVFGCADSRVVPEVVFDRGLGDLFTVRTAGHTLDPATLGSVEFGVAVLRTPLVAVVGHQACGGVRAAHDVVTGGERPGGDLGGLVDAVIPSVRRARAEGVTDMDDIVAAHVRRTVERILERSATIAEAVGAGRCAVVGMVYRLDSGEVRVVSEDADAPAVGSGTA